MENDNKTYLLSQIRERLAANSHIAWSGWIAYMLEHSRYNKNGSVTIPKDLVARWARQMKTSFDDLSKKEQESDYVESERIMNLMKGILTSDER